MYLQLFKHAIATFLFIFQMKYSKCDALLLKCPLHQMHLQKLIGFRPPLEYMNEHNLIYAPANNYKDRNRIDESANENVIVTEPMPITTATTTSEICWRICNEDIDCIAYVHLLDTNECYGYSYFERTARYQEIGAELPLVSDAEAIFYEKTCLNVPKKCKNRLWALTKIPGTSLIFQEKKTIATLVTRRECAEKCLYEEEFNCLSASFAPSYRNNRERFVQNSQTKPQYLTLGRCMLSDKDKMLQPDAFRAAPYNEEYIENQCFERPMENASCAYELYANSTFIYAEAKYIGLSQKECQTRCTHETTFFCQGASYYFMGDIRQSECQLHSEDIISMGPRSLKLRPHSIYMRRVKCLDVQVICTRDEMTIKYTPKETFQGKMYVSLHSKDCVAEGGNNNASTILHLAIGSEAKENRCGILRAYEVTQDMQRTFISALVVIQNNRNVQTQGDRLIKVGCIMSNATINEQADDMEADATGLPEDDLPNAIALESSLEYTQHFLPNEGALHFNNDTLTAVPKVTLQVVDLSHQHQANDVQIGQNLELQIVAEYSHQQQLNGRKLPSLPDFRATTLIAKTEDKQNYVLLIDEYGCPTDVSVFPAFERLRTHSKNILRARFHAFKFAGTSDVNFAVQIHFCERCPEDNCLHYGTRNQSKWQHTLRKRRQTDETIVEQQIKIQNPVYISTVEDVNTMAQLRKKTNENIKMNDTKIEDQLGLNYNLHVHGPDQANSNSFIYGERGVLLIAGTGDRLDTFCVNQSLLIATLIFWLIFQVALLFGCCYIIQKYKSLANLDEERRKIHESLEYLEGRRVHWADQGGYTL